jgi:ribosomal-protein-alanine N-acetyltransferase
MLEFNFSPFPVLNTERLHLRRLGMNDDQAVFLLRSDETVNRYLKGYKHANIEQTRNFINKINEGIDKNESIFWIISYKDFSNVGSICLWNISKSDLKAEVGYVLHPDFHGRGFMREALNKVTGYAFSTLGLKEIEAWTHKENKPSISLLERCGFKKIPVGESLMTEEDNRDMALYSLNSA